MTRKEMIVFIVETIRETRSGIKSGVRLNDSLPPLDAVAWNFADKLFETREEKDFFISQTVEGAVKRPRGKQDDTPLMSGDAVSQ